MQTKYFNKTILFFYHNHFDIFKNVFYIMLYVNCYNHIYTVETLIYLIKLFFIYIVLFEICNLKIKNSLNYRYSVHLTLQKF